MQINFIGHPPPAFTHGEWQQLPKPFRGEPLFTVDGVFVFGTQELSAEERMDCMLAERSGRPVIRVGAVKVPVHRPSMANLLMVREFEAGDEAIYEDWFASRPHTNYASADCGLYDVIEAAITGQRIVVLSYLLATGDPNAVVTQLVDTLTRDKEEHLQMEDKCWIRMDRILSVDGVPNRTKATF